MKKPGPQHPFRAVCVLCLSTDCEHLKPTVRQLTRREASVVWLMAQAMSNKEIAFELDLTLGTVKVYVTRIYKKIELAGKGSQRVAAAQWVRDHPALFVQGVPALGTDGYLAGAD